jgi:hypothetical protein
MRIWPFTVLISAHPDGTKRLVAVEDGYRESLESRATLAGGLKRRGLERAGAALDDGVGGLYRLGNLAPELMESGMEPHGASQAIAAVLRFLKAIWPWIRERVRRSYLSAPELLELKVTNEAHLQYRTKERDELIALCQRHVVVFLSGRAGSGKSALVHAGVVPALNSSHSLFPLVMLETARLTDDALFRLLADACREALGPEDSKLLLVSGLSLQPSPQSLSQVFAKFEVRLHRRPLLILDQMDDTIAANLPLFRPDGARWIRPDDLRAQRPFWNWIADVIVKGHARCLFVASSDFDAATASFRFHGDHGYYPLDRLDPNLLEPIIRGLTRRSAAARVASPQVAHRSRFLGTV